jgi:hypothetical protein
VIVTDVLKISNFGAKNVQRFFFGASKLMGGGILCQTFSTILLQKPLFFILGKTRLNREGASP